MHSAFERRNTTKPQPVELVPAAQVSHAVALTPIQKANLRMKELRESGELVIERLNPIERSRKYPKSFRAAVTANCWQCQGAGADPNVRQSVRDCAVKSCALHHLRPWQNVLGKSADQMTDEELENAVKNEEPEDFDEESEA